jgi:hypothetical protein
MTRRKLGATIAACALTLLAAACGSSGDSPSGLVINGPGLSTSAPPWQPEYAHLPERTHKLGLPPVGNEKFHIHAALHIYKNGLLLPVPAEIGLVPAKHIETSLHTHDATGIIHMETIHPFKFTLGDFFSVWGVKLGPAQVGDLTGLGGDKLHFYLNGKPLRNPAAYVMKNGDNISIGYGPDNSFPHSPGTRLLREVEEGKAGLNCSATTTSKKAKSCLTTGSSPSKSTSKEQAKSDGPKTQGTSTQGTSTQGTNTQGSTGQGG